MHLFRRITHNNYLTLLTALFSVAFLFLAIDPHNRQDWALENFLVLILLIVLFTTAARFPLSRISYTLIFIFLAIHEIGAHYTYSEVPYEAFFQFSFHFSLNGLLGWERNNFDRIVHFLYGLLLAYPMREFYFRVADAEGFWGYSSRSISPCPRPCSTNSSNGLQPKFLEETWVSRIGGLRATSWDAHKDMLLASLGALLALLLTMCLNMYLQNDFAREWSRSLHVKHPEPMGEDEIVRLLDQQSGDGRK